MTYKRLFRQGEEKPAGQKSIDRKTFVKSLALTGAGISLAGPKAFAGRQQAIKGAIPIGVIGLDISHSTSFTRMINFPEGDPELSGFQVVAAYPHGSRTIESSYSRIPQYTEDIKKMGVEIVDSIDELLARVEFVLLLTNDGHRRLEQSLQVMEAGKPMYMDKPVAGSLKDAIAIYDALKRYQVPAFTSSSLRFIKHAHAIRHENKIGEVLGVEAYSPSIREETHPDLFWYGIHGVETLFAVLGSGCRSVTRTITRKNEVVVGMWDEDRIGTFRGLLAGRRGDGGIAYGSDEGSPPTDIATVDAYGGIAYGAEAVLPLGPYEGYKPLVVEILEFFRTGTPPVTAEESLEIYAFMEAADESKRQGGAQVPLDYVLDQARS